MKRRSAADGGAQQLIAKYLSGVDGSRFVDCPACGRSVGAPFINAHLDACLGSSAAAAPQPPQRQQQQQQQQQQHPRLPALPPETPPVPGHRPGKEPVREEGDDSSSEASPGPAVRVWAPFSRTASSSGGGGSRGAPIVATAYRAGAKQGEGLTAEQLFAASQCELAPAFLPPELADQLLGCLVEEAREWTAMTWWMPRKDAATGQTVSMAAQSSKTSCHYELHPQDGQGGSTRAGASSSSSSAAGTRPAAAAEGGDEYGDQEGESRMPSRPAPPPLQLAADMVAAAVDERIRGGRLAGLPLEAADRRGWQASYVVANHYPSGSSGIGPHSDRLSKLGPCPIIASLTLGATRTFRLHSTQRVALPQPGSRGDGAGSSAGGTAAAAAAAGYQRIDVDLPHNALLVMWPPCQEAWRHEVPKTSQPFRRHPASGSARFNLTFRRLKPDWEARAPPCRCGRPSQMKAWVRKDQGATPARELRYYYACDTSRGPSCNFWQAAPFTMRL